MLGPSLVGCSGKGETAREGEAEMIIEKIIGYATLFGLGFLLGLWAGEERSAAHLKPCPMQMGMVNTSSVLKDGNLSCRYEPEKIPKKL
jgi:hypothetical protein